MVSSSHTPSKSFRSLLSHSERIFADDPQLLKLFRLLKPKVCVLCTRDTYRISIKFRYAIFQFLIISMVLFSYKVLISNSVN